MKQLILLYWGCVFLMYLSQAYYPSRALAGVSGNKEAPVQLQRMDLFMILAIVW